MDSGALRAGLDRAMMPPPASLAILVEDGYADDGFADTLLEEDYAEEETQPACLEVQDSPVDMNALPDAPTASSAPSPPEDPDDDLPSSQPRSPTSEPADSAAESDTEPKTEIDQRAVQAYAQARGLELDLVKTGDVHASAPYIRPAISFFKKQMSFVGFKRNLLKL